MRINAELTRQDLEAIYELTYKYQMLKQEAALGDYGVPQQLPDNAYIAFEKIKQELSAKLADAFPVMRDVFSGWLDHHVELADSDLFESLWEDTQRNIRTATSYTELQKIFNEDELREAFISIQPELEQFATLQEITDYTEALDPNAESALFKEIKTYLAEHPALSEIIEERAEEERENNYSESAIADVQDMLEKIESAYGWSSEAGLNEQIKIFQEALTTAHNNGSMAEYILGGASDMPDSGAVQFLSSLSNDPAYAAKWDQDLAKLLGYPVGSRLVPKQEWFSAHLKKAIRMITALLRVPNLEN